MEQTSAIKAIRRQEQTDRSGPTTTLRTLQNRYRLYSDAIMRVNDANRAGRKRYGSGLPFAAARIALDYSAAWVGLWRQHRTYA